MNCVFKNLAKAITIFLFCISANAQNSWVQKTNFSGSARSGAVSFVVGSYAYVGLGYTGTIAKKDFWRYDHLYNSWYQIADFGGIARQNAVSFVINDTVYVGTGDSGSPNYTKYKDFWKYNPSTNKWISIADFGGTARTGAVAFSIGSKGYVATGSDDTGELKDVWEYDQATNAWTQKADFTSDKRKNAVAFTINGKGYICSGWSLTPYTNILSDVQEYNPATDKWTEKIFADGSLQKKQWAGCFVLNNNAYLISGNNTNSVVIYNPATNALSTETDFGPTGETQRNNTVAFAVNGKGYAGLGYVMVSVSNLTYKQDLWVLNAALPPNNPSNLSANAIDNEHVQLNWSDNSTDETYFFIESSKDNNAQFTKIDSVNSNVRTYTTKGLTDSTKYYFRVRAKNGAGFSGYSNEISATTFAWHKPAAPTNLKVTATSYNDFNLSWTDNATNDSTYYIEVSEKDSLHFVAETTSSGPSCTLYRSSTKDSTKYFFRIRAKNHAGYSSYSNIAYCTTILGRQVGLTAVTVSPKEIDLMWRDNSLIESGFIIERSVNDSLHFVKIDSIAPYTGYNYYKVIYKDNSVTQGNTYFYRIAAVVYNKRFYCNKMGKASPLEAGGWIQLKDYPGVRAENGVGFYYNDKVYLGLGWYGGNQFWAYDPKTTTWTKKTDLGGKTWAYASTFLINDKGYACMGSFDMTTRNQVWEYDFANDKWTQKSNAPLQDRYNQTSFSLGNKGYILGGKSSSSNTDMKDFWEYDGATDTWTQLADFPGGTGSSMPVFFYNNKPYLLYKNQELWEFSLPSKTWIKVRTLKQPMGGYGTISLDEKFISFSLNFDINAVEMQEYDFVKDTLVKKGYFPGYADGEMVFIKGNKELYVGCGAGNGYTSEFWVYNPFTPSSPTKLTATSVTQKKIALNWNDNSNSETKYFIERCETYLSNFAVVDSVNADVTSYNDTTVVKDKSYTYRVRAKNELGYSNYTNVAYAITKVPDKPDISYIYTNLDATWVRVMKGGYSTIGIMGWIVERSDDGAKTFAIIDTIPANNNVTLDTGLIAGKEYTYRIKAYNSLGNSAYSNTKKVIPGSFYHGSIVDAKIKESIYFDSYGWDAEYNHCSTLAQTIYPAISGNKLTIDFKEFSLYGNDSITIYNGSNKNCPVLGKFTSANKPNSLLFAKNSEGSLTIALSAACGYGLGNNGWMAIVKSTPIFFPSRLAVQVVSKTKNTLNWVDNSDNETKFIIERSLSDSLHFSALDSVAANITSFTDTTANTGSKYYYRIAAIDANRNVGYSNNVSAKYSGVGVSSVKEDFAVSIFPNPASSYVTIRVYSSVPENATITVLTMLGQPIRELIKHIDSGSSDFLVDIQKELGGLYYVQIKTKNGIVTKTLLIKK